MCLHMFNDNEQNKGYEFDRVIYRRKVVGRKRNGKMMKVYFNVIISI